MLACFPEEQHELGLLGTALRLRHAGMLVTLLGQRTPAEEVGQVARDLKAELVGLSAVTDPGAREFESVLSRLVDATPKGTAVWVGGPAALVHRQVGERLGVRVFENGDDWVKLLGG